MGLADEGAAAAAVPTPLGVAAARSAGSDRSISPPSVRGLPGARRWWYDSPASGPSFTRSAAA